MSVDTELVPVQTQAVALIGPTPEEVLTRASGIAHSLAEVLRKGNCTVNISGRQHVKVEGWTTLLAMLMVQPQVVWTRRVEDVEGLCWEARVVLIHQPTGREVSSGEAMASDQEPGAAKSWGRNDFSVRSMAQTRAVGKAARLGFSWIMVLSGFEPTPAEEMPTEAGAAPRQTSRGAKGRPAAPSPIHIHEDDLTIARRQCFAVLKQLVEMCKHALGRGDSWSGPVVPAAVLDNTFAAEALRHLLMGDGAWNRESEEDTKRFLKALYGLRNRNIPPDDATDLGPTV